MRDNIMADWDHREGWYALMIAILSPEELSADEIFVKFFGLNLYNFKPQKEPEKRAV